MYTTSRIRMARKPQSQLSLQDYKEESLTLAAPKEDEVAIQARFISLDPYLSELMRRWQGPQKSWSEGIIVGRMVGQIIGSTTPKFNEGDWVIGESHWQGIEVIKAKHVQPIEVNESITASAYLGVLGASGLTAWVGTRKILNIQANETLTISSAAGTVGAIAGQLAKAQGAQVVGIAGGKDKCTQVVKLLGFDHCIDYQADDFEQQLTAAVPTGIDAHYENVGAKTLDAVLPLIKDRGRIGLCGLISHYLDDDPISLNNFRMLLTKGLNLQAFRVYDHLQDTEKALSELKAAIINGDLLVREQMTTGLSQAPQAYLDMLMGKGTGKHLIALEK